MSCHPRAPHATLLPVFTADMTSNALSVLTSAQWGDVISHLYRKMNKRTAEGPAGSVVHCRLAGGGVAHGFLLAVPWEDKAEDQKHGLQESLRE